MTMFTPAAITATLFGVALAFVLHRLTGFLRLPALLKSATVLGWLLFAAVITPVVFFIVLWLSSRDDPYPGKVQILGMAALYALALLSLCAGLGVVHARRYTMPWARAFGVVMTKFGIVIGTVCLLAYRFPGEQGSPFLFVSSLSLLVAFFAFEFAPRRPIPI